MGKTSKTAAKSAELTKPTTNTGIFGRATPNKTATTEQVSHNWHYRNNPPIRRQRQI